MSIQAQTQEQEEKKIREKLTQATSVNNFLKPLKSFLEEEGITEIAFNNPSSHTIFVEKYGRWEEREFKIQPLEELVKVKSTKTFVAEDKNALLDGVLANEFMHRKKAQKVVSRVQEKKTDEYVITDEEQTKLNLEAINNLGRAVAAFNDNDFSEAFPILSAVLPNGERCQFVRHPAVPKGKISMTIRRPSLEVRTMDSYIQQGFFNEVHPVTEERDGDAELLDLYGNFFNTSPAKEELISIRTKFLQRAVELGRTIVIAGSTGSGKTTFMKTLMQSIPREDRIITIEDCPELVYGLPYHHNQVNLLYPSEATDASVVNASKLMKSCLRMKPDRILLAELRGAETFDWINSVLSGHAGSITSCHATNCTAVFDYLALKVAQNPNASGYSKNDILTLLDSVIDIIVHIHNEHGNRHITEVYFKTSRYKKKPGTNK